MMVKLHLYYYYYTKALRIHYNNMPNFSSALIEAQCTIQYLLYIKSCTVVVVRTCMTEVVV